MLPRHSLPALLASVVLAIPVIALADVPSAALEAMKGRQVVLSTTNDTTLEGELAGFTDTQITIVKAEGSIAVVERSDVDKMDANTGSSPKASATSGIKEVSKQFLLTFPGSYDDAFSYVEATISEMGGKLKTRDRSGRYLEGSFKFGLNVFGLRVGITFVELPDGGVQMTFRGFFKDALDGTGAARKKAREVASAVEAKFAK